MTSNERVRKHRQRKAFLQSAVESIITSSSSENESISFQFNNSHEVFTDDRSELNESLNDDHCDHHSNFLENSESDSVISVELQEDHNDEDVVDLQTELAVWSTSSMCTRDF